ncbi:MAG TPA: response regulator [Verrucomicrobiae bacterium]|nr:response regulator [Verrucomicrobiae bacterium]
MRDVVLVHSNEKLADLYHSKIKKTFRVNTAHDGLTAIRLIKHVKPHLVLTEYDLPWLSGLGVLKFVRQNSVLATIPVLVISHRDPDPEALDFGASEWLKIPTVSVEDIANRVIYHLMTNKIIK